MTTYYKVLRRHEDGTLRSCHGGDAIWPEPKKTGHDTWEPGAPAYGHAKSAICSSGIHLTTEPMAWLTVIPAAIFLAEPIGPGRGTDADKTVFDGARLIEPIELPFWWQNVEAFIAEIQSIRWLDNRDAPLPHWKVFENRYAAWNAAWDAARDATWHAAWDAARDAARDATWNAARDAARYAAWNAARDAARYAAWNAARDAARDATWHAAWHAAWDAAWDATWHAAWDAAWDAARDVAWDAAWDAALYARVLVCGGLDLAQKHIDHATARMEVWKRGYGLVCDVYGVLYVYKHI